MKNKRANNKHLYEKAIFSTTVIKQNTINYKKSFPSNY